MENSGKSSMKQNIEVGEFAADKTKWIPELPEETD